VGGGSPPRPGEISLAHGGVLFLDELPEFSRRALEVLRQPLEEGTVVIARAARATAFPARFQLVAAMNPCPCGFAGDARRVCRCTPQAAQRYASRLSGPLRDRIDLTVDLAAVPLRALSSDDGREEASASVRARVVAARARQASRYAAQGLPVRLNGALAGRDVRRYTALTGEARRFAVSAAERLGLSARAHDRVLRVARTIADLQASDAATEIHVGEALQFRGP
jgi:magnesium chelatase family protein